MPVAGDTVEKAILADILTTLQGIVAGPEYNTTVRTVRRQHDDITKVPLLPGIIIVHEGTQETDSEVNGLIDVTLSVGLSLGIDVQVNAWQEQIVALQNDVKAALRSDWTRGGNALATRVISGQPYDATDESPVAGAEVFVTVKYRHLYQDPTRAF